MPGISGGFAGKGFSNFSSQQGLHLRPPLGDPLFAIRRYLCLQPTQPVGPVPGPPVLVANFVPLITGEDPIIIEPWEDVPVL